MPQTPAQVSAWERLVAFARDLSDHHPRGISAAGRRSVRVIPACSPQWAVLYVMREALRPEWAPAPAAARLLDHVHDPFVLRHARGRLQKVIGEHATLHEARAVATLNLAIGRLEDAGMRE